MEFKDFQSSEIGESGESGIEEIQIEDGGHVIVECSDCKAPLLDIWITGKTDAVENQFIAECPHCGDKSYLSSVKGLIYMGVTDYTHIENVETEKLSENLNKTLVKTGVSKKWKR